MKAAGMEPVTPLTSACMARPLAAIDATSSTL